MKDISVWNLEFLNFTFLHEKSLHDVFSKFYSDVKSKIVLAFLLLKFSRSFFFVTETNLNRSSIYSANDKLWHSYFTCIFSAVREDRMPGGRNANAIYSIYKQRRERCLQQENRPESRPSSVVTQKNTPPHKNLIQVLFRI